MVQNFWSGYSVGGRTLALCCSAAAADQLIALHVVTVAWLAALAFDDHLLVNVPAV